MLTLPFSFSSTLLRFLLTASLIIVSQWAFRVLKKRRYIYASLFYNYKKHFLTSTRHCPTLSRNFLSCYPSDVAFPNIFSFNLRCSSRSAFVRRSKRPIASCLLSQRRLSLSLQSSVLFAIRSKERFRRSSKAKQSSWAYKKLAPKYFLKRFLKLSIPLFVKISR